MTFVIALTGGIASGKSLVANQFQQLGVPIIDSDHIARTLVIPGSAAHAAIVEHFGDSMLTAQGELNRPALRQHIFTHSADKTWLEQLMHPAILKESRDQLAQSLAPYALLIIPLLVETWERYDYSIIDRVCLVDCLVNLQISRLMQRDHLSQEAAENILQQQASREQRLALADDVIVNDSDSLTLAHQVTKLHDFYIQKARAGRAS